MDRNQLSADERALLAPFVSNTERDVFVLRNLPEATKGAVFARYSRSPKPLRRLLIDEFREDLDAPIRAVGTGGARAERMYQRVFVEYGDDSVAQLGGAHVALEQISNVATKIVEWGRLASYLEQSTRYMAFDDKPDGHYRYHRPSELAAQPLGQRYVAVLDGVFDAYAAALPVARAWLATVHPRDAETSERAWRASINAKACDLLRGLLPAATTSNVGMYASGQAYEQLLLRLAAADVAEARDLGAALLAELRTVIPAFLERVDRPDRGVRWSRYLADTRAATRAVAHDLLAETAVPADPDPDVTLVDFDPDAEDDVLVGMLYPHAHVGEHALRRRVATMTPDERIALVRAYVGDRANRRHRPGRALERARYRFDICGDYGAFRDLQRHRMCTIEWQELSCRHGYDTPDELEACGLRDTWDDTLARQAALWEELVAAQPRVAPYAVGFAWRVRYSIQLNARAAMHLLELRSGPQGHASYRRVSQHMHRLIAEQAGHHAIAEMMSHVDHTSPDLGRLDAERRADARRAALPG